MPIKSYCGLICALLNFFCALPLQHYYGYEYYILWIYSSEKINQRYLTLISHHHISATKVCPHYPMYKLCLTGGGGLSYLPLSLFVSNRLWPCRGWILVNRNSRFCHFWVILTLRNSLKINFAQNTGDFRAFRLRKDLLEEGLNDAKKQVKTDYSKNVWYVGSRRFDLVFIVAFCIFICSSLPYWKKLLLIHLFIFLPTYNT